MLVAALKCFLKAFLVLNIETISSLKMSFKNSIFDS